MAAMIISFVSAAQTVEKATKNIDKQQNNVANPNQDATMSPQEQKSKSVVSGNSKKSETTAKTSSTQSTDGTTRPDGTGTGTPIKSKSETTEPASSTKSAKK